MFAVGWDQVSGSFAWDGSRRKVRVRGADLDDWQVFLEVLREGGFSLRYSVDGREKALPARAEEIFRVGPEGEPRLDVALDGIELACRFLAEGEIQLDLDPRQVDEDRFPELLAFMAGLGDRLKKEVALTPESLPEEPILKYAWRRGEMEVRADRA